MTETPEPLKFTLTDDLWRRFDTLPRALQSRARRGAQALALFAEDGACHRVPRGLLRGLDLMAYQRISREDRWLWLCSVLTVESLEIAEAEAAA